MDWRRGITAEYFLTNVDASTWRDLEREEIRGGTVKKEKTGLMQSADIECQVTRDIDTNERWVRVWLNAEQAGEKAHIALFTGLACSPEFEWQGFVPNNSYECYSVVKPCEDVLLERGWYAQAGENTGQLITRLLGATTPAPVRVDGVTNNLQSTIIAEDGESYLSMAQKIAEAGNVRIRITGMGEIVISQKPTVESMALQYNDNDIVEPEIKVKHDWYSCPNVFRAIDDDLIGIARDDSENSLLSTYTRGREIWMEEINADLNDGETIAEYAERRLHEEQSAEIVVEYDRRYVPDIDPTDLLYLNYPELNIIGLYEIQSQSIELSYGAKISEEVAKIWQG